MSKNPVERKFVYLNEDTTRCQPTAREMGRRLVELNRERLKARDIHTPSPYARKLVAELGGRFLIKSENEG